MIERVGIIGGGQLGMMLTEAAIPLGFSVDVVDPSDNCPATQVGADQIQAALSDRSAIAELAQKTDILTWEIEHIPSGFLIELANQGVDIEPNPRTLQVIQDKLDQKELLQVNGIPVAPFSALLDESEFVGGGPFVVKARKGGYDGRGNLVVESFDDERIDEHFGDNPVYVEQGVTFEKELSVIIARDKRGKEAVYPVVETIHKDNICHLALSPAEIDSKVAEEANEVAHAVAKVLKGAGVFAIEMFVVGGHILVNEIAPRVHNSGHHTIEASQTSQFEQHIRAVTGMPLGSTEQRVAAAAMINILGTRHETDLNRDGLERVLALPDTHPHFYSKIPKPQRKIGHITILGSSINEVRETAQQARKELIV